MKTILNTSKFEVKLTGRDYDFIAVIENNEPEQITIELTGDHCYLEPITVPGNDWVGLLANDEGYLTLEAFEQGDWRYADDD